jgi:Protein phosphatase 2C
MRNMFQCLGRAIPAKNNQQKGDRDFDRPSEEPATTALQGDESVSTDNEASPGYWKALARYAPGTRHQKHEIPCQDFGDYKIVDRVIIGVVADGAGSAKFSDTGSKLAVRTVLEYFAKCDRLLDSEQKFWIDRPQASLEHEARKIFIEAIGQVLNAFQVQSSEKGWEVRDLACTLLVFIATPNGLLAMQIGDGFIVVRFAQEEELQKLFEPIRGEHPGETTFVTSSDALDDMQVCVKLGKPDFICASTDGLELLATKPIVFTPSPRFFTPLEEYIKEIVHPEQEDGYLIEFLNSERLNKKTDDDKTLLLCCYNDNFVS